eukprot:gene4896-5537_t
MVTQDDAAFAQKIIFDDVCGSGWRDVARKWKLGESGKQNSFKLPKSGVITEQTVAIFSDSQMRPVVKGDVKIGDNWYVNSTPSGPYIDVAVELKTACRTAFAQTKPIFVVFVVGTNDLSRHMLMEKAEKQFRSMLLSASVSFPNAKVVVTALSTGLNEFENRIGIYNAMMAKVISEKNGIFLPLGTAFEKHDTGICVIFSNVANGGEPSRDDREEQGGFITITRTKKKSRGGKSMCTNGRLYMIDNVLLKRKCFNGLKKGGNALSKNELGGHAAATTTIGMPVLESELIVNNFARTPENLVDTKSTLLEGGQLGSNIKLAVDENVILDPAASEKMQSVLPNFSIDLASPNNSEECLEV